MKITAVNPSNNEVIETYEEMHAHEVSQEIENCHAAFQSWKTTDFSERADLMTKLAGILREKKEEHARLMTSEMGKPVTESRGEMEKCAWLCDYYAENAKKMLLDEYIETDASKSYVAYRPLGIILGVMPWNYPFWQVMRFAVTSISAGNTAILKHASNVPGCALAIERLFIEAGFPQNVFKTLLVSSGQVGAIIENPRVKAVTLTGSTPAGIAVARKSGEMLKKTVMELGGSDAYVVLEDADIERSAAICVKSRLLNSGQSCIAAKRFIVVDAIYDEFVNRFSEIMKSQKMGDPLDEDTVIGPLARHDLRDDLHRQVEESIEKGARCILGGKIPNDRGAYYPPTILVDVKKGMPAYDDEIFGPVASVIRAKDERDAVSKANDSVFGLGGAVFSKDLEKAEKIAVEKMEAGMCFVNDFVRSDPRLPFGGIKESGYGRELARVGIREFVNIKTIFVK